MNYLLKKIRAKREFLGISQQCMAEKIGISRENYNAFENGRRTLTDEKLVALILLLGASEKDLRVWQAIDEFGPEVMLEAARRLQGGMLSVLPLEG